MIASGTRLGPYTITASIGAGGMGEVYKATDTRLNRTVAIKVLPEHVASDPDLTQRFEREAKTLAALSHPHICPIHDVGSQDGIDFLVMEYLEGETLEQRLKKGALPLDQALQIGIQIADALAAAHRAGIIHRDLKPGNIMLTRSGAKLLDFGLAKTGVAAVAGNHSMLPTTAPGQTQPGAILGTFEYMAPEQLEGHESDSRTDIFAFGAVLYEMVTGEKAFSGKTQASLIAAILDRDPVKVSTLQPLTPYALERVVHKCLAKGPDDRWQTARDLMDELLWIQTAKNAVLDAGVEQGVRKRHELVVGISGVVVLAAVLAAGAAFWMAARTSNAEPSELLVRFSLFAPHDTIFGYNSQFRFAVSPDGRHVAFVADTNSATRLWLHSLESPAARQVPGTSGIRGTPFWSPDSRTLAFFLNGKLHRVDVAGGVPQAVTDLPSPLSTTTTIGGTWNSGGTILFAAGPNQPIFQVAAAGGVARPATVLATGLQETHGKPSFLPDGRRFLFVSTGQLDKAGVWIASLDGGDAVRLLDRATQAAFVESHLVFIRDGLLLAQRFDPATGQLAGEPQPVGASVVSNLGQFSASQTGRVLGYTGGTSPDFQFSWVDRGGRDLASVQEPAKWGNFDLSLDQRYIVTSKGETLGSGDIWLIDLERGVQTRLTFANGLDGSPVWSPDGQRIAFTRGLSNPRNECQAVLIPAAGGKESIAYHSKERGCVILDDWSPDGRFLTFNRDPSLMALPLTSDPKPWPFVQTANANLDESHFSPDGKWIAYSSNESGTWQVSLAPFPPTGERWQISANGGVDVRWRADGQELYFLALDGQMMAVDVRPGLRPGLAEPRPLFQSGISVSVRGDNYAVTNDGQRFLLKRRVVDVQQAINMVLNWTVGLNKGG